MENDSFSKYCVCVCERNEGKDRKESGDVYVRVCVYEKTYRQTHIETKVKIRSRTFVLLFSFHRVLVFTL